MAKIFEYRVYDSSDTFKFTLPAKKIKTEPRFSSNINGGQGTMSITISEAFGYDGISTDDIIRVYIGGTQLIYTGSVQEVDRVYADVENITYTLYGLAYFWNLLYNRDTDTTFTVNEDPQATVQRMIGTMNTDYNYYIDSTTAYGTTLEIEYSNEKCREVLTSLSTETNYWWYIDQAGVVKFAPRPTAPTHILQVARDVNWVRMEEDQKDVITDYSLVYDAGTVTSTATGLKRERIDTNTSLLDVTSAQEVADNYIDLNGTLTRSIQIEVNSVYDIESLQPGDSVRILGIEGIDNLQIHKVDYSIDRAKLTLEQIKTFTNEIIS